MRIKNTITIVIFLACFLAFPSSNLTFESASAASLSDLDFNKNNDNNLDATAYYAEHERNGLLKGKKTNIMQKHYGKDPEIIASVDGKIDGYRVSPDRRYIAVNQKDHLSSIDTYNGDVDDLMGPKKSIWGMTYSPDGSRMIATEKGRGKDYYIHDYNLRDQRDNIIYTGQSSSRFYPYAWRPDNIIIFIEVKSGNENVWCYDLNQNDFYQSKYRNPYWISEDGRYAAMASDYEKRNGRGHRIYNMNNNRGYSDSYRNRFGIYDPVSSRYYGDFGNDGYNNSIVGYYPDQNEILYQSYKKRNQMEYYYYILGDQSYRLDDPYDRMNRWNDNSYIGADVEARNGRYVATSGRNTIFSSTRPIQIIICFSDDAYRNIPTGRDYNYRDGYPPKDDSRVGYQTVSIRNNNFSPSTISVNTGDTIRWINYDDAPHTVTSVSGSFDSGNIAPGESYTRTFSGFENYRYFCRIHPEMRGTINVRDDAYDNNDRRIYDY